MFKKTFTNDDELEIEGFYVGTSTKNMYIFFIIYKKFIYKKSKK